jgi:hypothetical protein
VNEALDPSGSGGGSDVGGAFDIHSFEVSLVRTGLAERGGEVTNAVDASQLADKRFRIQDVATSKYRAMSAQLFDAGAMFRSIATVQTGNIVPRCQCALDEMRPNESGSTSHEYPHIQPPILLETLRKIYTRRMQMHGCTVAFHGATNICRHGFVCA